MPLLCGCYGGFAMIDGYTIAFLVVPLVLAALGWAYALLADD
jgi:hypothetical protein